MSPLNRWSILASALLLAACQDVPDRGPKLPRMADAMPNVFLPPGAELVSREGSADAIQLTLRSSDSPSKVADYYRSMLTRNGWRLLSDVKARDGGVTLYAESNGPPLWVRVWSDSAGGATMVQLAGAVVRKDSAKAARPGSAAPSSRERTR